MPWHEAVFSLDPMFLFIYEYPRTGPITLTHTDCTSPAASHLFVSPHDHRLAGIYGTLVIFYIYPLRLLLSRLIIVLCDHLLPRSWHQALLQPQRNVFGYCRGDQGDEHDKNNNPLLIHVAKAQQLVVACRAASWCVCVCVWTWRRQEVKLTAHLGNLKRTDIKVIGPPARQVQILFCSVLYCAAQQ